MVITLASGITVSTLPALVIKALTHKRESGTRVDDDHSAFHIQCESEKKPRCSPEAEDKIARLPTAGTASLSSLPRVPRPYSNHLHQHLPRCLSIDWTAVDEWISAIAIAAGWSTRQSVVRILDHQHHGIQSERPVAMVRQSLSICRRCGAQPTHHGRKSREISIDRTHRSSQVVMSGTSFFPIIIRNTIQCVKWFAPWHHQVVFEYILLNNHRLSTVLFPTIQTRIYLTVTFVLYALGIGISLVLDYSSPNFAMFPGGLRLLIFGLSNHHCSVRRLSNHRSESFRGRHTDHLSPSNVGQASNAVRTRQVTLRTGVARHSVRSLLHQHARTETRITAIVHRLDRFSRVSRSPLASHLETTQLQSSPSSQAILRFVDRPLSREESEKQLAQKCVCSF